MRYKGFTLIELLVVVIIMGVLTSIALPQYRKAIVRARMAEVTQLLPAIFEARERWMIEHQCKWDNSADRYTCLDENDKISFNKLDIEMKGTVSPTDPLEFNTKDMTYKLISAKPAGSYQRCVSAYARSDGKLSRYSDATIFYRGDKIHCSPGSGGLECGKLNLTEGDCD